MAHATASTAAAIPKQSLGQATMSQTAQASAQMATAEHRRNWRKGSEDINAFFVSL